MAKGRGKGKNAGNIGLGRGKTPKLCKDCGRKHVRGVPCDIVRVPRMNDKGEVVWRGINRPTSQQIISGGGRTL